MTNCELEARLRQATERAVPDELDAILSRCDSPRKGTVIVMEEKKKSFSPNA